MAAANYVGMITPPTPICVETLSEATRCSGPQGAVGLCFLFEAVGAVAGKVYFFPRFASIWIDGEPRPRSEIPTEMIANRVPGYLQALGL